MIQIPYEKVIDKIKNEKDLSSEQVEEKIKSKLEQLSGLISREGAAYIVANELGIKLVEASSGQVTVNNVLPGMRNVDIVGKPIQIYEVRTFQKQDSEGKVGTFLLGDETGIIRVVCWGNNADILSRLDKDTVVRITSAYAKENRGRVELHANDRTSFALNPPGVSVTPVQVNSSEMPRKLIKSLDGNEERVEIGGTIVQVFDLRFYTICPSCGKRARDEESGSFCPEHGLLENPDYGYVLNLILDDGTDTVRCALFRKQVDALLEKPPETILLYRENPGLFDDVKTSLLGEIVVMAGRTQKNEMFQRVEFVPFLVDAHPDPQKELEKIKALQGQSSA